VPDMDVSIGVGQCSGDEDLAGHATVLQSGIGGTVVAAGSVRSRVDCVNMPTFGEQQLPENQA
jgi:hypothetical protein